MVQLTIKLGFIYNIYPDQKWTIGKTNCLDINDALIYQIYNIIFRQSLWFSNCAIPC